MRNSIPDGGNAEKQKADLLFPENHGTQNHVGQGMRSKPEKIPANQSKHG